MVSFGSRKSETRLVTGTGVAFICALFALLLLFVLPKDGVRITQLRQTSFDVLLPVIDVVSWPFTKVQDAGKSAFEWVELRNQNSALVLENQDMRQQIESLTRDRVLLSQYRNLLSMPIEVADRVIGARVVADLRSPFVKTLVVNRGESDGLAVGQAVMGVRGLVGRVISVGERSSRILLVSDFNSHIPVVTISNNVRGIMSGLNAPSPALKYLPRKAALLQGDTLVTSGDGGQMPIGLPVGKLAFDETGAAFVDLYDDLDQLVHVRLVLSQAVPEVQAGKKAQTASENVKP
ncbi:rod shape-determining protein MreC [Alphaproteobacteria bacterium]|nr:rod shape-determining protein MreC [Alphaproteobacteria bacterium]